MSPAPGNKGEVAVELDYLCLMAAIEFLLNRNRQVLPACLRQGETDMNQRIILILLLVSLTALFIVQNIVAVEIRFLFWSIVMSRSLLVLVLITIGIVVGWFLHSLFLHRGSSAQHH